MIPVGWKQVRLGDHVVIFSGDAPANVTFESERGLPYVKVEDMNLCAKYQSESREYVSGIRNPVPSKSVIFPKRGAAIMGNKVRIAAIDIAIDTNLMAISPTQTLDSEFLYYSITHTKLFEIADTSTIPQINNKHILPYQFLLPSLAEQRRIAEILSTWDRAIEATERLIANSQAQKKALMQQLLTGKKRLPGFCGEWRDVRLSDIAEIYAGGTPSTSERTYWDGDIPWMASGEVNLREVRAVEGRITSKGLSNSSTRMVPENSVLVALAVQGKTRGKVAINRIALCTNQSLAAIVPRKGYCCDYLFHNLDSRYEELRSMSLGDGGQGGLNLSIIGSVTVPMPSEDEQRAIAHALTLADRETFARQREQSALRTEKSALMQQLLTGKRRVKLPSAQEEAA